MFSVWSFWQSQVADRHHFEQALVTRVFRIGSSCHPPHDRRVAVGWRYSRCAAFVSWIASRCIHAIAYGGSVRAYMPETTTKEPTPGVWRRQTNCRRLQLHRGPKLTMCEFQATGQKGRCV